MSSESARKKQRLSPEIAATPNATARTEPITPFRRAVSAGPTPAGRTPTFRTPGTAARTPRGGPATRPISARRAAPTTPHAIRALRERANAARTPGNNRRRSGRVQRETPRDLLRNLSRGATTPCFSLSLYTANTSKLLRVTAAPLSLSPRHFPAEVDTPRSISQMS